APTPHPCEYAPPMAWSRGPRDRERRMERSKPRTVALVLAGAVAKGAFEAGAVGGLARGHMRVGRAVPGSSGAVHARRHAGAVGGGGGGRAGPAGPAGSGGERARGGEFPPVDGRALVNGRGVSDPPHIVAIRRDGTPPVRVADPADIDLRIVLAATAGMPGT